MINEKTNSIWRNNYVCRLGILDHCNEIQEINKEIIRKKNQDDTYGLVHLNQHFNNECIDLYLILQAYFGKDQLKELAKAREEKFKLKETLS